MKGFLFKIIMKFFKKNLEDVFIESEIKAYQIDKDNKLFLEKLSDLYQSPEYKVFSQLISNRPKGLAMQGMRLNYSNDKELCIQAIDIGQIIFLKIIYYPY